MAAKGRIKGNSYTGPIRPEVTIMSMTESPIGTLFSLWWNSRHSTTIHPCTIECIYTHKSQDRMLDSDKKMICEAYPEHAGSNGDDAINVIKTIVLQVIEADLPPTESVSFTIDAKDVTVAWREQLVRSKFASYWTQTSRTADLRTMDVNMSDTVELFGGQEAVDIYKNCVDVIRDAYTKLMDLGVPVEDIRLAPESRVHRVPGWMINLRSLIKIMNKRSDWIAQSSLWAPIIAGICRDLRQKSPALFELIKDVIGKPAVKLSRDESGVLKVVEHHYSVENDDRLYNRDPQPVDPLYLAYTGKTMPEHTNLQFYDYMKSLFIQIWDDEYLEVLGWDRKDPHKIGPYDKPI